MKKKDLATLAMIGISTGLLIGGCQQNQKGGGGGCSKRASSQQFKNMDMQSFQAALSPEARQKFLALDTEHKKMAMEMAEQGCKGKNACKGKGGCKTADHACAGKNACKGKGGEPVENVDKAVAVQFENQSNAGSRNQNGRMMRNTPTQVQTSGVSGDLSPEMQDFYKKLSVDGQRKFLTLDAQHKMMAMQMTQQSCNGKNECKGMGGCKTNDHACAGKNGCKGLGGKPIGSAEKAVEVQYGNQSQRENTNSQMRNR